MRVLLRRGDIGQGRNSNALRQPEPPGGLHDPSCAIRLPLCKRDPICRGAGIPDTHDRRSQPFWRKPGFLMKNDAKKASG
jgi:hypothetical protein